MRGHRQQRGRLQPSYDSLKPAFHSFIQYVSRGKNISRIECAAALAYGCGTKEGSGRRLIPLVQFRPKRTLENMLKMTYVVFNMNLHDRLEEFCLRLLGAPACASKAEAFELLSRTLIEVENEFSGIAFDPAFPRDDGRMYPPRDDAHRTVPGRDDLHRYRSQGHHTYFSEGGAILIVDLNKVVVLDKADHNARSITL